MEINHDVASGTMTFGMLGVSFFLKIIEWMVSLDAVMTFVMHGCQALAAIIAAISGLLLIREKWERWRNSKPF